MNQSDSRDPVGQFAECGETTTPGLDGDDVTKRIQVTGRVDDLRTRIAAVHQAHRWGVFRCNDGYARTCCRCQWRETPDSPTHAEHVADVLIRELRLTQERRSPIVTEAGMSVGNWLIPTESRYVTEWIADE